MSLSGRASPRAIEPNRLRRRDAAGAQVLGLLVQEVQHALALGGRVGGAGGCLGHGYPRQPARARLTSASTPRA